MSFVSSNHAHSIIWFFACYCWWNIRLPVVYFNQIERLVKSVGAAHRVSKPQITGDVQFCLKCYIRERETPEQKQVGQQSQVLVGLRKTCKSSVLQCSKGVVSV